MNAVGMVFRTDAIALNRPHEGTRRSRTMAVSDEDLLERYPGARSTTTPRSSGAGSSTAASSSTGARTAGTGSTRRGRSARSAGRRASNRRRSGVPDESNGSRCCTRAIPPRRPSTPTPSRSSSSTTSPACGWTAPSSGATRPPSRATWQSSWCGRTTTRPFPCGGPPTRRSGRADWCAADVMRPGVGRLAGSDAEQHDLLAERLPHRLLPRLS